MSDFPETRAANATIIRARLRASTHEQGWILSVYRRREAFRDVRFNQDDSIQVKVGNAWHPAYLAPTGLGSLIVRHLHR